MGQPTTRAGAGERSWGRARALASVATFAACVGGCAEPTVGLGTGDPGGPGGPGDGTLPSGGEDLAGRASTPVDLVFILDATVSMGVESTRVVDAIDALVEALPADLDIKVGVDLNDVQGSARREQGRISWTYAPDFPFATDLQSTRRECVSYPQLRGCLTGTQWVGPSADGAVALREVVDVGNCSTGQFDASIDTVARVLHEAEGGCNRSFFREGTRRVVVIITDGTDFSEGGIDGVVAQLRALGDVRLAVLNGQRDGAPVRCGTGPSCGSLCASPNAPGSLRPCAPPSEGACAANEQCIEGRCISSAWANCAWCDAFGYEDCCHAEPGARDVELAAAFAVASGAAIDACARAPRADARCLLGSICDADLRPFFRRVAESLLGGARQLRLAQPLACPGLARVFVVGGRFGARGVELTRGEEFETSRDGRSVLVRGPRLPLAGERARVVDGCAE